MNDIDKEVRDYLLNTPKNSQHFKVGDCVVYYVHVFEMTEEKIISKHKPRPVKAEIIKVNRDGTYDIKKTEPQFEVETNWPEKYLFPCTD